MTTPTLKELAERLRLASPFCHKIEDCLHCELYDIAAALDAMPEVDEALEWRREVSRHIQNDHCQDRADTPVGHGCHLYPVLRSLWNDITGTPWTPPEPERVSDEELDKLDEVYSRLIGDEADAIKRVLRELRARRAGGGHV